jgi:hypothetical protein
MNLNESKSTGYNKGDKYEDKIFNICKEKGIIALDSHRAGASNKSDIVASHNGLSLGIEVKSAGADYGQKYLEYQDGKWNWSKPDIITNFYDHMKVIGMIDPKFIPHNANHNNLSSKEWGIQKKTEITTEKKKFDQKNFEQNGIPLNLNVFFEYYKQRDCYYIQIDGSGFYHMYEDKYNLGTSKFDGGIHLRLRAKAIHAHEYWHNDRKIKSKTDWENLKKNSKNNNYKFSITESPWWYSFLAVIKANKPPTPSIYSIDEMPRTQFPKFIL